MEKINKLNYDEGIVCAIDFLGFSSFSKDEHNFYKIKNLFNEIADIKNRIDASSYSIPINMTFMSDTVLLTSNLNQTYSHKIISGFYDIFITYIRYAVNYYIGTDIRAAITYGQFLHTGKEEDMFFGPAITRAITLAEKKSDILDLNEKIKNTNPASIIIDNVFQSIKGIECINNINFIEPFYEDLGCGYYALNPFACFEYYNKNEKEVKKFFDFQKAFLDKQILKEKYWFLKELLSKYISYKAS